jgi:DNA mismatch endonuclease (patch repair protein)
MADIVSAATRSRMMSGIRSRDTRIEVQIRRALHARGFRFRLDVRSLPGRPDIVLPKWNAVIFVHGCFWHLHGCGLSRIPSTRTEFWRGKLEGNAARDARNTDALLQAGWRVAAIWECATRGGGSAAVAAAANALAEWLVSGDAEISIASPAT